MRTVLARLGTKRGIRHDAIEQLSKSILLVYLFMFVGQF